MASSDLAVQSSVPSEGEGLRPVHWPLQRSAGMVSSCSTLLQPAAANSYNSSCSRREVINSCMLDQMHSANCGGTSKPSSVASGSTDQLRRGVRVPGGDLGTP